MTANRDLERRIAGFYATEAPLRAPDRVLAAALATIETTPQRRALVRVPWRFPAMSNFARLAVAAVAVIAVGAVGLTALWGGSDPGPGSVPSPTATQPPTPVPTPTASPSPVPTEATASGFRQPFTYLFPTGVVFDYGARNATWWEARIPDWFDAGHAGGIIVQAIGGGRADPCDGASAPVPIAAGAAAVMDYLGTVADLTVSNESATTVGSLPAIQATVVAGPERSECPELWLWVEDTESFSLPRGMVLRMIAVDVGGEHLVLTVFGEVENPQWPAMADELIASFRFQAAP